MIAASRIPLTPPVSMMDAIPPDIAARLDSYVNFSSLKDYFALSFIPSDLLSGLKLPNVPLNTDDFPCFEFEVITAAGKSGSFDISEHLRDFESSDRFESAVIFYNTDKKIFHRFFASTACQ